MSTQSEPLDQLVGEVVDERWKLVAILGTGGMGVVYRGERVKLGKAVAVKFLDERAVKSPESVARFEREARAISRLQHRHCVSILDFGVWRQRPYIVMEYIAGQPLHLEMGTQGMTPVRAVRIMRQILEALRHAHAAGVVHRDLKPENVMLTESTGASDFVKLLDFGLARIISVDEPTISVPKMIAGTPSYMSPEQARGEKADHRTDIYSAGVILYGMCTGRKPFKSDNSVDLLRMHMNAAPVPPRKIAPAAKISPALERVILRALEKERDARFYHADEFLAALEAVPEARKAPTAGRRRRAMTLGAALLVAVTVVVGGGGWLWHARAGNRAARAPAPPSAAAPAPAAAAAPSGIAAPTAPAARATATSTAGDVAPAAQPRPPETSTASGATVAPAALATLPAAVAPPPVVAAPPLTANAPIATPGSTTNAAAATPGATSNNAAATGGPPSNGVAATGSATSTPPSAAVRVPAADAPPLPLRPAAPPSPSPSPALIAASPTRDRVTALLADDDLADAERLLLAEAILQPRAGWVHLQMGELYFRRLWRRDAEREWDRALTLDPALRSDPLLAARLCAALGPTWSGAGQRLIVRHVGAAAVAPLTECIRTSDDLARIQLAARLIERVAGRNKLDRALVAARTAALGRSR